MKIIPAILPQRYRDIEQGVEKIYGAASTVQIDIVDGVFAPNKTWLFNSKDEEIIGEFEREERGMPHWESMNYEFDLMVRDPLSHIEKFLILGPSKIIFHLESFEKDSMLAYFEKLPEIIRTTVEFGVAISIGTPPEDIAPYIPYITTIQCMGIANIGYQGQLFDARTLAQVHHTKELYPDKTIVVDGGMNHASIPLVATAGATQFIVGSAIFGNDDTHGTIRELQALCNKANTTLEN